MDGASKSAGGRPRKFQEASRPVTVTLPHRTLEQLREMDPDRAKAIVKAVDSAAGAGEEWAEVEVIEMAAGIGLLVVSPNESLKNVPWINMIEIAPRRYLLSIESGTAIEKVELELIDRIEEARRSAPRDVPVLEVLREKLGSLRRRERVSKAEILLVHTGRRQGPRPSATAD